jgi:hypothetical protein
VWGEYWLVWQEYSSFHVIGQSNRLVRIQIGFASHMDGEIKTKTMSFCKLTLRYPALDKQPVISYCELLRADTYVIKADSNGNSITPYFVVTIQDSVDWYQKTVEYVCDVPFSSSKRTTTKIPLPSGYAVATPLPDEYYGELTGTLDNEGWTTR